MCVCLFLERYGDETLSFTRVVSKFIRHTSHILLMSFTESFRALSIENKKVGLLTFYLSRQMTHSICPC